MGQFEYSVGLAEASTPEDMKFVADAFAAGQDKEKSRIYSQLIDYADGKDTLAIALFKLRKIVYND